MRCAKDSGKPVNYTLKVAINGGGSAASGTAVAEKARLAEVAGTAGVNSSKIKVFISNPKISVL